MSDFNTPPAAPNQSRPSESLKYVTVAILAAIAVLLVVLVTSRGGESAPPATDAPARVEETVPAPAPQVSKYDSYYQHVMENSGKAQTMMKSDVIEFGDLVCQTLDEGYGIGDVVRVLADASTSASDTELAAAVTYGAIAFLCPEYKADLAAYLNN